MPALTAMRLLLTEPRPFDAELKCSITSQLDFLTGGPYWCAYSAVDAAIEAVGVDAIDDAMVVALEFGT